MHIEMCVHGSIILHVHIKVYVWIYNPKGLDAFCGKQLHTTPCKAREA